MIQLQDAESGAPIGPITDAQLQFLIDRLEEESPDDRDYYINRETVDGFEEEGADPALVALLRKALGEREEMEIRWTRT
jgi:processive 1,2-diacylglycerol beta-glucosyltransferase